MGSRSWRAMGRHIATELRSGRSVGHGERVASRGSPIDRVRDGDRRRSPSRGRRRPARGPGRRSPRSATAPGSSAPTRSRRPRGELERVARETGASIIIETVDTLEGEPADQVAISLARRSGIRGVFILIARKERKLEVLGSGHYQGGPDRRPPPRDPRRVLRGVPPAGLQRGAEARRGRDRPGSWRPSVRRGAMRPGATVTEAPSGSSTDRPP